MTDKAELKKEVIKDIRSILQSSQSGLTLRELEKDYSEFIGRIIPFRDLGYLNTQALLKDLPDVVRFAVQDGNVILHAVCDETTEHIQRLVSRQRTSKKRTRGGGRGGRKASFNSPRGRTMFHPRGSRGSDRGYLMEFPVPAPVVPSHVRNLILKLFEEYSDIRDGIPLTHYNSLFSKKFSRPLDFEQIGFSSLRDCLESVSDIALLKNYNGEIRVLPVKDPCQNQPRIDREPSQFVSHQISRSKPTQGCRQDSKTAIDEQDDGNNEEQREEQAASVTQSNKASKMDSSGLNPIMVQELKQLLASKPKGIWNCRLPFEYKARYNRVLHAPNLGYRSVIELVSAIPDITISRPDPSGDWILFYEPPEASGGQAAAPEELERGEKEEPSERTLSQAKKEVPDKVKDSIREFLLAHYPEGIDTNDFQKEFEFRTSEIIELSQYGFSTLEDLLFSLSMSDSLVQLKYGGVGELMVYPVRDSSVSFTQQVDQGVASAPKPKKPLRFVRTNRMLGLPFDAVGPGTEFLPLHLPPMRKYFELIVSTIHTPSQLWFQRKGSSYNARLDCLMNSLEVTYKRTHVNIYKFPTILLEVGQICAALFPVDNSYHRAIITKTRPDDDVEVFYVDYGGTCTVNKSSLQLLRKKYLTLPVQAIQARLCNLLPVGKKWREGVQSRMLQLTASRSLVGYITGVSTKRVVSINLTDTTEAEDVHINDLLVDEGYATLRQETLRFYAYPESESSEIFDETRLYGKNFMEQHAALVETKLRKAERKALSQQRARWVQPVAVGNYLLHVVNVSHIPYLVSSEFSAIFWNSDFMYQVLKQMGLHVEVTSVILERKYFPRAFQELEEHSVSEVDPQTDILRLFAINDGMLKVMDALNASPVFKSGVDDIIKGFNPNDPYWRGEEVAAAAPSEYPDTPDPENSASKLENGAAQLENGAAQFENSAVQMEQYYREQQVLRFRRQRLLSQMMGPQGSRPEIVTELERTETVLGHIQTAMENLRTAGSRADDTGSNVSADSDGSVSPTDSLEAELMEAQDAASRTNRVAPIVVSTKITTAGVTSTSNSVAGTASCAPTSVSSSTPAATALPSSVNYAALLQHQLQQQQQALLLQQFMMQQSQSAVGSSSISPPMWGMHPGSLGMNTIPTTVSSEFQRLALGFPGTSGMNVPPQVQPLPNLSLFARPEMNLMTPSSFYAGYSFFETPSAGQTSPPALTSLPQGFHAQWSAAAPGSASSGVMSLPRFQGGLFSAAGFRAPQVPDALASLGVTTTTVSPSSMAVGGLPSAGHPPPPSEGGQTAVSPEMLSLLESMKLGQGRGHSRGHN